MPPIANREALERRRGEAQAKKRTRDRSRTLVNVSCGTCGIASGAELVWETMQKTVKELGLEKVDFLRSGCMTYCYAEPTVIITRPGANPVLFGKVDENRARKLVVDFIANNKPVDGVLITNYERVILE